MRLGEHLSPSGEKVVRSLLEESDEFLDTVDALWNLRVLDAEKVFVKINDEIQASIMSSAMRHRFERELTERYITLHEIGQTSDYGSHDTLNAT